MNPAEELTSIVRRIRKEGYLPNAVLIGTDKLVQLRKYSRDVLRLNPDQTKGDVGYLACLPTVQIFQHPDAGARIRFYETELLEGATSHFFLNSVTPIALETEDGALLVGEQARQADQNT